MGVGTPQASEGPSGTRPRPNPKADLRVTSLTGRTSRPRGTVPPPGQRALGLYPQPRGSWPEKSDPLPAAPPAPAPTAPPARDPRKGHFRSCGGQSPPVSSQVTKGAGSGGPRQPTVRGTQGPPQGVMFRNRGAVIAGSTGFWEQGLRGGAREGGPYPGVFPRGTFSRISGPRSRKCSGPPPAAAGYTRTACPQLRAQREMGLRVSEPRQRAPDTLKGTLGPFRFSAPLGCAEGPTTPATLPGLCPGQAPHPPRTPALRRAPLPGEGPKPSSRTTWGQIPGARGALPSSCPATLPPLPPLPQPSISLQGDQPGPPRGTRAAHPCWGQTVPSGA